MNNLTEVIKMKTKKKITTAVFGTVSLLFLTVTMSYGQNVACPAGKITTAGSGVYSATTTSPAPAQRVVWLRCNTAIGAWAANTTRMFKLSTNDLDGKYATALTALALTGETVRFSLVSINPGAYVNSLEISPATL
jgi:hypothetical protein